MGSFIIYVQSPHSRHQLQAVSFKSLLLFLSTKDFLHRLRFPSCLAFIKCLSGPRHITAHHPPGLPLASHRLFFLLLCQCWPSALSCTLPPITGLSIKLLARCLQSAKAMLSLPLCCPQHCEELITQ